MTTHYVVTSMAGLVQSARRATALFSSFAPENSRRDVQMSLLANRRASILLGAGSQRGLSSTLSPAQGNMQGPSSPRAYNVTDPSLNRRRPAKPLPRRKKFVLGEHYAPRDLNLEKAHERKPRRARPLLGPPTAQARENDLLYRLNLKPGHPTLHDDSYKNPVLLSTFVSEMGKIESRSQTGLTRRSQREVGKAVRRARAMGLMPVMRRNVNAWYK